MASLRSVADSSTISAAPPPAAIQHQLARILASQEFQVPERGRAFLQYIVNESLAGRAERLKGYSIAVQVFGREEGFSQDDPVVRIEAGRLRRALERYYLVAGQNDPIRIDIPKGGYVPTFAGRAPSADETATPVGETPLGRRPMTGP